MISKTANFSDSYSKRRFQRRMPFVLPQKHWNIYYYYYYYYYCY